MATQHHYRPGSFYRIDARTGFAERAERTRKEWTGQLVRERSWEPRQSQDFVRGVVDNETVPEPRPRLPQTFAASGVSALASNYVYEQLSISGIADFSSADFSSADFSAEFAISDIGGIAQFSSAEFSPSEFSDEFAIGDDVSLSTSIIQVVSTSTSIIQVVSTAGWYDGDVLWIMRDVGDYWRAEIEQIEGDAVTISPAMVLSASAGNQVVNIMAQARVVAASAYPGSVGGFDIGVSEIDRTSLDEFGPAPESTSNQINDGSDFRSR